MKTILFLFMNHCCDKKRLDYIFFFGISIVFPSYVIGVLFGHLIKQEQISIFINSNVELIHKMWWGVLLGIIFVGILDKVPRQLVVSFVGREKGFLGILKATMAGLVLDLCSHGILLVGMKFYERGVRLGQVMAFLIASPWNSISLTLILWSLIGIKLTLLFILLSAIIAVISGLIFEMLVDKKILPGNPNKIESKNPIKLSSQVSDLCEKFELNRKNIIEVFKSGFRDSKIIIKWIFVGIIMASLIRSFVPADLFKTAFGPTISGLFITLIAATIIEVCSEGSTPIASDILSKAGATGNSFTFLMSGVSTDYTEIMSIKETTSSWKIALFLPLVTLPQILFVGFLLN